MCSHSLLVGGAFYYWYFIHRKRVSSSEDPLLDDAAGGSGKTYREITDDAPAEEDSVSSGEPAKGRAGHGGDGATYAQIS